MKVCPECGKPITENAVFCKSCGARLVEKTQAAPSEKPTSAPVKPEQPVASAKKKSLRAPLLIGGIVLVLAAAIAVLLILILRKGKEEVPTREVAAEPIIYAKDGTYYLADTVSNTTTELFRCSDGDEVRIWCSTDLHTVLYTVNETLYAKRINGQNEDPVRIDENVLTCYFNEDCTMFEYDVKTDSLWMEPRLCSVGTLVPEIVPDKAARFGDYSGWVYRDESGMLYAKKLGKEPKALDRADDGLFCISQNDTAVYYFRSSVFYRIGIESGEIERIAGDVYTTIYIYPTGEAYFVAEDSRGNALFFFDGKQCRRVTDDGESMDTMEELFWYHYGEEGHYKASYKLPMIVYRTSDGTIYAACGAEKVRLGLDFDEIDRVLFDDAGRAMYLRTDEWDDTYLYRIRIRDGKPQPMERLNRYDPDFEPILTEDGRILFMEEADTGNGGRLCIDSETIGDDVWYNPDYRIMHIPEHVLDYIRLIPNTNTVVYQMGKSKPSSPGTIMLYRDGKSIRIAGNASCIGVSESGEIVYEVREPEARTRTLYAYRNGQAVQIAEHARPDSAMIGNRVLYYRIKDEQGNESWFRYEEGKTVLVSENGEYDYPTASGDGFYYIGNTDTTRDLVLFINGANRTVDEGVTYLPHITYNEYSNCYSGY